MRIVSIDRKISVRIKRWIQFILFLIAPLVKNINQELLTSFNALLRI